MFDLKDLYQEVIIDHNRSPRNFGKLENPTFGERLTVFGAAPIRGAPMPGYATHVLIALMGHNHHTYL